MALPPLAGQASGQTPPSTVAVAGDLDHLLGCTGDWAPDCDQAQMTRAHGDIWSLTATLPAGSYHYKAALNKSWDVNYGQNATPGGADIPLTVPQAGATVTFLFDQTTHLITDSINTPLPVAVGDCQTHLGCAHDNQADCVASWLEDPDGDGTATYTTTALPAGTYHASTAVGLSDPTVYGQDGTTNSAPAAFTVAASSTTTFSYSVSSHRLSVYPGQPKPSLKPRKAYWLSPDRLAWGVPDPAHHTYQLAAAPDGGMTAGGTGITGASTTIPLTYDPAGLPAAVRKARPDLAQLPALRIPAQYRSKAAELLRGQVAIAEIDTSGNLTDATGLQSSGALDGLYAAASGDTLGPAFRGGRPTLSVWAPTAHSVSLELYDTATTAAPRLVPMRRDNTTGTWSVTGDRSWKGKFYRYQVTVWAPTELRTVTNHVTDPYSVALSANSTRSQIVDLNDPALAPAGWQHTASPPAVPSTRQEIQELHLRDFSAADTTVPADRRGTYLAFTDPASDGMKHLKALAKAGVTTVQLTPAFDFAGTEENRAQQSTPPCDLASYAPDSERQQACVAQTQNTDAYNWATTPATSPCPRAPTPPTPTDPHAPCSSARWSKPCTRPACGWSWTWSTTTPPPPARTPPPCWTALCPATTSG